MKSSTSVIHFETRRDNKTRWVKQAQLEGGNLVDWITDTLNQRCYDYNVRAIRTRENKPHETLTRDLADMERTYGLLVEYVRPDGRKPGWYEIRDWGVLDEQRIIEQSGTRRSDIPANSNSKA
jgi:hypothetical protein